MSSGGSLVQETADCIDEVIQSQAPEGELGQFSGLLSKEPVQRGPSRSLDFGSQADCRASPVEKYNANISVFNYFRESHRSPWREEGFLATHQVS
jgi:hypothetical protein